MAVVAQVVSDISVVAGDSGEERVVVEVKRTWTHAAVEQLLRYMRVSGAHAGLIVAPDRSLLVLPPLGADEPGVREIPTWELLGPIDAAASEHELVSRVRLAVQSWIDSIDRGEIGDIPRSLIPDLVWPLHGGKVLLEYRHGPGCDYLC